MCRRSYTLVDFATPPCFHGEPDDEVRFLEYVRTNLFQILPGLPLECEVDLFASGHAHNPERLLPLVGVYAPAELVDRLPHPNKMIDAVTRWCRTLSEQEAWAIARATPAPTWAELQRLVVHPRRPTPP